LQAVLFDHFLYVLESRLLDF